MCAAAVLAPLLLTAGAVRSGFDANQLWRNDDSFTGPVTHGLGVLNSATGNLDLVFGGANRAFPSFWVNNNGNITLDGGMSTYTPFSIISGNKPIIAPFFADVDTRPAGSNIVSYGTGTVDGRAAYGINYVDVGYYSYGTDKLNSFQLVLVDRSDVGGGDFDIEFNYDQIQWETGGASGGSGGLGGSSARAGYSNGLGLYYELPGSGINGAFLDGGPNALTNGSFNSSVLGRYIFHVRNGFAIDPGTNQDNPILPPNPDPGPDPDAPPVYVFTEIPSRRWVDPPGTYGFDYVMTSNSLFTELGLPTGFDDPFDIWYGNGFSTLLGSFPGGGANLFFPGGGVSQFRITGIHPTVNSDNSNAFPVFLAFDTPTASFTMTPLVNPASEVPEPSTWLLFTCGAAALLWRRRR
jgi:hypothetical protein